MASQKNKLVFIYIPLLFSVGTILSSCAMYSNALSASFNAAQVMMFGVLDTAYVETPSIPERLFTTPTANPVVTYPTTALGELAQLEKQDYWLIGSASFTTESIVEDKDVLPKAKKVKADIVLVSHTDRKVAGYENREVSRTEIVGSYYGNNAGDRYDATTYAKVWVEHTYHDYKILFLRKLSVSRDVALNSVSK